MAARLIYDVDVGRRHEKERVYRHLGLDYDEQEFRGQFRFSKENVSYITNLLEAALCRPTLRSYAIPAETQVMLALKYFGTGSPMKVIRDTMGDHISSVSRAVRDVSGALCQKAWSDIADKVNSVGGTVRNVAAIKDKWKNLKNSSIATMRQHAKHSKGTGKYFALCIDKVSKLTEIFICKMYGMNNLETTDSVRRVMFEKACKPEAMPSNSTYSVYITNQSYEDARAKLRLAEETSDLQTESDRDAKDAHILTALEELKSDEKFVVTYFSSLKAKDAHILTALEEPKIDISFLGTVGGCSVMETTRRIMKSIMTNGLAQLFNWKGKGEKSSFSSLELKSVVANSVRRNPLSSQATDCEVEKTIKEWLRFAKDRDGGRKARNNAAHSRTSEDIHTFLEQCEQSPEILLQSDRHWTENDPLEISIVQQNQGLTDCLFTLHEDTRELLFTSIPIVAKALLKTVNKQLVDFLPGGKYCDALSTSDQERIKFAPLTNLSCEHHFGDLDSSQRRRPNASFHHHSSIQLLKRNRNHLMKWVQDLDSTGRKDLLMRARKGGYTLRKTHLNNEKDV
ncbi:putative nuclease HARBI1 [Nymphon striatum]|nr:putative nuclease HARBI1 [Nymphon striatum]